jgi:hypothetical protein
MVKGSRIGAVALALISSGWPLQEALGATYKASFVANGISSYPVLGGLPPPTNPLSGSITFAAASLGSPISSILAVDLVIGSHSYTVAEVGATVSPFFGTNSYTFGGLLNGVGSANFGTNDFWFTSFGENTSTGILFYTTPSSLTYGWAADSTVSVSITTVPEPATSAAMVAGLLALSLLLRKRRH